MAPDVAAPVRLAIVNDYEILVSGLAAMLEEYRDRVHVVEINAQTPVLSDVDVVLVDSFGQLPRDGEALAELVRECGAPVVLFSWELPQESVAAALQAGCLRLSVQGAQGQGGRRCPGGRPGRRDRRSDQLADLEHEATVGGDWPGQTEGLSPREAEVLAFITQGLSNQQIAETTYLSINSVKTYIRTGSRKIGVARRVEAVSWGMQHGFAPASMRHYEPAEETSRPEVLSDTSSTD